MVLFFILCNIEILALLIYTCLSLNAHSVIRMLQDPLTQGLFLDLISLVMNIINWNVRGLGMSSK